MSLRQKLAAQKLSEIIRNSKAYKNISMGAILRQAGYSKQTSLKPRLVTKTKGFTEELNRLIPDNLLLRVHSELLEAMVLKKYNFTSSMTDRSIRKIVEVSGSRVREIIRNKTGRAICYFWAPDAGCKLKALDMAYRVKGLNAPNREEISAADFKVIVMNYGDKLDQN